MRNQHKQMTLIEMIIVIVLITVVTAVVAGNIAGRINDANVRTTELAMLEAETQLAYHFAMNGRYPSSNQGLRVLADRSPRRSVPTDGWKRPLTYQQPSDHGQDYDLVSYGRDGEPGGDSYDADIVNWFIGKDLRDEVGN